MYSLSSDQSQSWLSWFLRGILILVFLILLSRLFEIQIIKGSYYRGLSEENRIRHIPLPAARGNILARGGEVLVGNTEGRYYFLGEAFGHASGYVGAPEADRVGKIDPNCPEKGPTRSDVLVGKNGLELEYNCMLAGIPGEELVEVDTTGKVIRSLGKRDPVSGKDIKTTIDYNLQRATAASMKGKKGAAIVTDPKGGVLAFYSEPSYDPNLLVTEKDNAKISQLFTSLDLPFFNRVIGGTFHPGSVFKPLTAIAALQEGAIEPKYTYTDTGSIIVNDFSYSNWYFTEFGGVEGIVDLPRALARSTDTFFYKIGELVGPHAIAEWAQIFGINRETGIDIPGEVSGLIPSPEWKKRFKKEDWFLGNTYHMAIGQGDVSLTPIAVNKLISAIANNGEVCTPHFLSNSDCEQTGVKQQNLDLVIEGMQQACSSGGTAYTFFDFEQKYGGTKVACKTGTAEVGGGDETHAWFTAFAPAQKPEIVLTILVEKGGQGSSAAGPVAREIMDYYFQGLRTTN